MDEQPAGDAGRRRPPAMAVVAAGGVVLVVGGAIALGHGLAAGRPSEKVLGILVLVLGLACVRAYRWSRRARLMAKVGRDLHGPHRPA